MRFSTRTLGLISLAIVINSIGGQISHLFRLPIFLDSIGTILAAVLEGPIVGAVTGLISNLVRS
jgi:energy-coupling factor transport system substrate-specific component